MYKALIVEDELPVRMYLKTLINWSAFGIELTEDAANGVEALERTRQYNHDIVILDIEMPLMNGLEVIRALKTEGFNGIILILSCHDDFESVREAMKLGAFDYILKHMLRRESLEAIIKNVLERLERENAERLRKKRAETLTEADLAVLKESLVREFIGGQIKEKSQIISRLRSLGLEMDLDKYIVIAIEISGLAAPGEKSVMDVLNSAFCNSNCIYGYLRDGEICAIINYNSSSSFFQINASLLETCDQIINSLSMSHNLSVTIGSSRICVDIEAAGECFQQAKRAVEGKIYLGKNRVIHYSEVEKYDEEHGNILAKYEDELTNAIKGEPDFIEVSIKSIFEDVRKRRISPDRLRALCFDLLVYANNLIKSYDLTDEAVDSFSCFLTYHSVQNFEIIDDIRNWFICVCTYINKALREDGVSRPKQNLRPEIRKVLSYLDKNYMNNISLEDAANYSNLSRTYFSRIFREEMGDSFSDYLVRLRIKKAKIMLKDHTLKIYEVAEACGFKDYRYFTKLFRSVTGVSPSRFIKK